MIISALGQKDEYLFKIVRPNTLPQRLLVVENIWQIKKKIGWQNARKSVDLKM